MPEQQTTPANPPIPPTPPPPRDEKPEPIKTHRVTDAVIGPDPVTGNDVPVDPRDMASDAEAAKVRDGLGIYSAIDTSIGDNPFVDERAARWTKQDSNGLKAYLVHFKDGSTYRVSRMLDQLADNPGSNFIPDGHGGVTFVEKAPATVSQGNETGTPQANPGATTFGGMDPAGLSNDTKAILARLDALDQKWSGQ